MPAPRIYPPDVADARRAEQRRRGLKRDRLLVKLFRDRHPRLYAKALAEVEQITNQDALPGDNQQEKQ